MQTLFKNANIVDIKTGSICDKDILVENGKISAFGRFENFKGDVVDLKGDYVIPNFVNVFCHATKAFEKTYDSVGDEKHREDIKNLMLVKNLLAGASCNDIDGKSQAYLLENIEELDEKELSDISNFVAQSKTQLFIKAGQSLEELGTIDKQYKKMLSDVLEDFGFLDRKPILIGGNCFEKDELQTLAQYDCDVCLTVGEDAKFGRRPTNLMTLNSLGFCVGLGSGYSFEIDFFAFMRQILLTQRGLFEDENCISEQEVLNMATFNGSKILYGTERSLKVGESADFIVVNKGLSLYDDIFKTLVWEKSKKDVVMTVFDGEILQKNGKIFMKNLPQYDTIIKELQQDIRRKQNDN